MIIGDRRCSHRRYSAPHGRHGRRRGRLRLHQQPPSSKGPDMPWTIGEYPSRHRHLAPHGRHDRRRGRLRLHHRCDPPPTPPPRPRYALRYRGISLVNCDMPGTERPRYALCYRGIRLVIYEPASEPKGPDSLALSGNQPCLLETPTGPRLLEVRNRRACQSDDNRSATTYSPTTFPS